jgi:hypothetical protein
VGGNSRAAPRYPPLRVLRVCLTGLLPYSPPRGVSSSSVSTGLAAAHIGTAAAGSGQKGGKGSRRTSFEEAPPTESLTDLLDDPDPGRWGRRAGIGRELTTGETFHVLTGITLPPFLPPSRPPPLLRNSRLAVPARTKPAPLATLRDPDQDASR